MRIFIGLLTYFLLLPSVMMLLYYGYSAELHSSGPYSLPPTERGKGYFLTFSTPTQSLAEVECRGGLGNLKIFDRFSGEPIYSAKISGQLLEELIIPHEGSYYMAYFGNGSISCILRFKENHPTRSVQNATYFVGIVSAFGLILYLWRGWKNDSR
ncbi:hypothetical protein PFDSM3638_04405 [Pyrococcus furiosus DSM 3638]|uniref:Uncharacterized protein n=3 Tax=Pyrococcus furiosus TaxID=2261 RepID=Q8U2F4_PYRFU|nr:MULTISPECIES: hypothetical protein [Pyrococcus]AAL81006.1 hypothetical protein PF0882 [Pyrococcus furiosus DSM 3638]AFN03671.1 hypothetical protein PFC_03610 [Pyrococcus furiosus COM1]MDK2869788.1 hypothetical protein [Pyrococcus sp.]QEK78552.1 hypothetical protein PFDSM3638_04405 [Pyrococcus furiosus DSM 3638]